MHSKADMPSNNTSTKSQSNQHDNSNPSPSCNSINQVRQIDSTTDNNKNIIIAKTNGFRKLSGKRDLSSYCSRKYRQVTKVVMIGISSQRSTVQITCRLKRDLQLNQNLEKFLSFVGKYNNPS